MLSDDEIRECFLDLLMEDNRYNIMSIINKESIFGKMNSSPYYQRRPLWEHVKKTNMIESLLIGTEIPPLILWYDENGNELIDGKQRYETIYSFYNNKFSLSENGLYLFKNLKEKFFKDLDKIHCIFKGCNIRTLDITMNTPKIWTEEKRDYIKRAIFRRYNMGITKLKDIEIQRAKYIENDIVLYFSSKLKNNQDLFDNFLTIMAGNSGIKTRKYYDLLEIALGKIRYLLALENIPINYYYSHCTKSMIETIFCGIKSNRQNNKKLFNNFYSKMNAIKYIWETTTKNGMQWSCTIFEALYWVLSVLEKEKIEYKSLLNNDYFDALSNLVNKVINPSIVGETRRYKKIKCVFENIRMLTEQRLNINLEKYCVVTKKYLAEISKLKEKSNIEISSKDLSELHIQQHKPEPLNVSSLLYEIEHLMYNLRPFYQRHECKDFTKASRIIESLLIKFKLPPIFVYIRKNGTKEIIDGQQRLLAIIAYFGKKYKNELGEIVQTDKHEFKLQGLEILKELNGLTYSDLPGEMQNKLMRAPISIIEIYEAKNDKFNPVDLFIRLNSRPKAIKEHSFENWNTILPKNFLDLIKNNTKKYINWFYVKRENADTRMENEELYTTIMFLEARKSKEKDIKIYKKGKNLTLRLNKKEHITDFLKENLKNNSLNTIKDNTEKYIEKLILLFSESGKSNDEFLKINIDKTCNFLKTKGNRSKKTIYALWYFVSPLNLDTIKENKIQIKKEIKKLLSFFNTSNSDQVTNETKIIKVFNDIFVKYQNTFIDKTVKKVSIQKPVNKTVKKNFSIERITNLKNSLEYAKNKQKVLKKKHEKGNTIVNISVNVESDNSQANS